MMILACVTFDSSLTWAIFINIGPSAVSWIVDASSTRMLRIAVTRRLELDSKAIAGHAEHVPNPGPSIDTTKCPCEHAGNMSLDVNSVTERMAASATITGARDETGAISIPSTSAVGSIEAPCFGVVSICSAEFFDDHVKKSVKLSDGKGVDVLSPRVESGRPR